MISSSQNDISNFFVAGINYKAADAALRGKFAVGDQQYGRILDKAKSMTIGDLFVLSTCNRTEIFGFAESNYQLINLLCSETVGTLDIFYQYAYVKSGAEAINHLFNVGAGLDSQILGDYEIIGQIKNAVKFSEERKCISPFMSRLVDAVINNSKEIKNTTSLSEGTSSVSFAAIKCIRDFYEVPRDKKVLVVGVGKIGRTTCKNLVHYLGIRNITIINRSEEKAIDLAKELELTYASYDQLKESIEKADIILVATSSSEPVILKRHFRHTDQKLIIDLSVPYNVEIATKQIPGISLVNVDDLSKLKDETIKQRTAQIPQARLIIANNIAAFIAWSETKKKLGILSNIKAKLEEIHLTSNPALYADQRISTPTESKMHIQRVINGAAIRMRKESHQGCVYISAINEFMLAIAN